MVASVFGCSSTARQETATDLATTTPAPATSSTVSPAAVAARTDLTRAIAQWQASCDAAQCARSTPDGLAQALADRARVFAPFASADVLSAVNQLAAAAERVVQLGGCVDADEPKCVGALQAVSFARALFQDAVSAN